MKSVMFVCHGNICRSPMAEFVFKDMLKKAGKSAGTTVCSCATSGEEIGGGVHRQTRRKLEAQGIEVTQRRAVQLCRDDYRKYDLLIGMDAANVRDMLRILGGDGQNKLARLLDYTGAPGDIADPWYTGDFDAAYDDISSGCAALLKLF